MPPNRLRLYTRVWSNWLPFWLYMKVASSSINWFSSLNLLAHMKCQLVTVLCIIPTCSTKILCNFFRQLRISCVENSPLLFITHFLRVLYCRQHHVEIINKVMVNKCMLQIFFMYAKVLTVDYLRCFKRENLERFYIDHYLIADNEKFPWGYAKENDRWWSRFKLYSKNPFFCKYFEGFKF